MVNIVTNWDRMSLQSGTCVKKRDDCYKVGSTKYHAKNHFFFILLDIIKNLMFYLFAFAIVCNYIGGGEINSVLNFDSNIFVSYLGIALAGFKSCLMVYM